MIFILFGLDPIIFILLRLRLRYSICCGYGRRLPIEMGYV